MDSLDLTVDLFKEVFPQFPEGSQLFVGDNIPEAICDGWLEGLMDYIDTESKAPGGVYASWYDGCIDLTPKCVKYLLEELIKDPVLVGYFIYYVVVHEDDILMLVFDGDSITLKSTIKVSPELYEACKENYVFVSFEDPVVY